MRKAHKLKAECIYKEILKRFEVLVFEEKNFFNILYTLFFQDDDVVSVVNFVYPKNGYRLALAISDVIKFS